MFELIRKWYERHFSDPQAVMMAWLILVVLGLVWLVGGILAPVLTAVVAAYLLEGVVTMMNRYHIPRGVAATIVLIVFIVFVLLLLFGLLPMLSRQVSQLVFELPRMLGKGQQLLMLLPEQYPQLFTEAQVIQVSNSIREQVVDWGQSLLSMSLANVVNILAFSVYAVLVPLMVFFTLKDKPAILHWFSHFVPPNNDLSNRVWAEVDIKIANYIRGKFIEILIVGFVSYITFALMGLNYALLLGFLVGVSVIVPFIGAVAVTVPVALIGFFQWGLEPTLGYLMLAYLVIQILDGNVLVPILFSEVVNLHPLAIIVAVLFFGGIWGILGVFFAIPLATFVQAILNSWPSIHHYQNNMLNQEE